MGTLEDLPVAAETLWSLVDRLSAPDLTLAQAAVLREQLFALVAAGGDAIRRDSAREPGEGTSHRAEGRHLGPHPPRFPLYGGD